ncbi:chaplin family protein [Streptomyces sp. CSDS2]|uniref:chaplin family protein n=1 Tax=Streptomyces sp. CSDS2 TaxID=3055051 RepID=UPI0025AF184F|nr:chaplin family protein [Streptomyces sp. CSDS2]MDN3261719.1 chaplin family protein [Streptomyces sp. CSDS2]
MRLRQNFSKGIAVAAAATGVLSVYGGSAFADANGHSTAHASPGPLAGNNVQDPVNDPADACGNSIGATATLETVSGSFCVAEARGAKGEKGSRHHDESGDPGEAGGYGDSDYGDQTRPSDNHSAPPSYGDEETAPPSYGDEETAPPSYGDEETAPPSYGDEETAPPSYGDEETAPPSYGDEEAPPPPGDGEHPPAQPPMLPHTGGEERAMIASSAAGAALIVAGTILYRRGRAAARR